MHFKLVLFVFFFVFKFSHAENVVINNHTFPKGFKLGVATAAYQVEGGWNQDGKGENMWDWFTHTYPEKIEDGSNGDIACDSYNKWEEDVKLLKELGADHYRLSIMWTRILPDGLANNYTINKAGVKYYRTLFEALRKAKISPYVTLYHWDLPLPFHQMGGWLNPVIADHFAEYARICFDLFGDLVDTWFTLNEPLTYCGLGYGMGGHAPGYVLPEEGIYKCAYTSILAHAKAYHIYNNEFRKKYGGRVSIVLNTPWNEPKTNSPKDIKAAERENAFMFGLFTDPIYKGNWPQIVIDIVKQRSEAQGYKSSRLPQFSEEDKKLIFGTSDFFSLNSYQTLLVEHQNNADERLAEVSFFTDKGTVTANDPSWPSSVDWVTLTPWGFRKLINYVHNTYGKREIFITENGWADIKAIIKDTERQTYIEQFLSAALDAHFIDGVNVTGYTIWSLMDNLEWSHGYIHKLGLVQVDVSSSKRTRTPKDSFNWFKNVITNRCLISDPKKCVK